MTEINPVTGPSGVRVVAVIVTFRPDPERFARVLQAIEGQATAVVIADNGAAQGLSTTGAAHPGVVTLDLGGNRGVAAAQNLGIAKARELGATHVLILDHDSICDADTVQTLARAWSSLRDAGEKVAAVGANFRDPRHGELSAFHRVDGLGMKLLDCTAAAAVHRVHTLISAGCLIALDAYDAIGPMNESLFIDYVDTEWGMRAQALGWSSFGVVDASMEHTLGDSIFWLFGKPVSLHSPLRHYYMTRNGLWMIGQRRFPIHWRLLESWRLLRRSAAYLLLAPRRLERLAMMSRGVRDAMFGRMGAYPGQRRGGG
jgi:rhamnosyltransferase